MPQDLLLEIGCEELPASFVVAAIDALPELARARLRELRLAHGAVTAAGTPRRLAVIVESVADAQPDLDEEVLGPPARVAFDAQGQPTKAATSFAGKLGIPVEALQKKATDKGEYVVGRKCAKGLLASELMRAALEQICAGIPFKKSMRWSTVETPFGRPVRWVVALLGESAIDLTFAGVRSGRSSCGHRFLSPGEIEITSAASYVSTLRERNVLVDVAERKRVMVERLSAAARSEGAELIEDSFLVDENASLVEEPAVVVGSFDPEYLALPERVILEVAKGHQRYFGMRSANGALAPKYLAVVNTALRADNVRRGNDRVMRARLSDAKFFYTEDTKRPLGECRSALDGIVFHKRLGSIGDKVRRLERLVPRLGELMALPEETVRVAEQGAALAKCDLVTLMVGELPELEGAMGQAYALVQGVEPAVAAVISEHYRPRGVDDPTAPSDAGALVAIADRIDTLTGCFAIGIVPTGAADPLALRRAAIGTLRTLLDKAYDLKLSAAFSAAYAGFDRKLDLDERATIEKLSGFLRARLRGLLGEKLPLDAVDAVLAVAADRPHDALMRASALAAIEPNVRALAGEVFKRATNIAKGAPEGQPVAPSEVLSEVHPSEQGLFESFGELETKLGNARSRSDYVAALGAIAEFAPALGRYFDDVYVMVDDARVRDNRLRLMKKIERTCSALANFSLLAQEAGEVAPAKRD